MIRAHGRLAAALWLTCALPAAGEALYPQPVDTPPPALAELGRYLFYDPRLSVDGSMSCASCHQQVRAFTDGLPRARGVGGELHPRNTPTLTNVGLATSFGWASEHTRLVDQPLVPLTGTGPVEMGLSRVGLRQRLAALGATPAYRARLADLNDAQLDTDTALAALAAFVTALRSFDAPYDRWLAGDHGAVGAAARRGAALFFSARLQCAVCHASINFSGPLRTRGSPQAIDVFHNTGLYNLDGAGAVPDAGRQRVTGQIADRGAFRAPTLRNVALTAPYMHDGSVATLDAVLTHYAAGGLNRPDGRRHPQQRDLVRGFILTAAERTELLAFLHTLTDTSFVTDPRLADPWQPGAVPFSPRLSPRPVPRPAAAAPPDAADCPGPPGAAGCPAPASARSPRR